MRPEEAATPLISVSASAAESTSIEDRGEIGKGESSDAANAVSLLQEYIQNCASFSPHTKILTWSFDQQLENDTSLQFRATVSFVFGDVPHHFSGGWQTSKKKSQRDAAERVRHYLSRRDDTDIGNKAPHAAVDISCLEAQVTDDLQKVLQQGGVLLEGDSNESLLDWKLEERKPQGLIDDAKVVGAEYRTTVTLFIHSVPHHFCGAWCGTEAAARKDTVERLLWYFKQSDDEYVAADRALPGAVAAAGPPQPLGQGSGGGRPGAGSMSATDDKTILMQVQNSLQKEFAKDTPPGQRVWDWEYDADPQDPQLFRARVQVPAWTKTFLGSWCRGKKLAQRSACLIVKAYLDEQSVKSGV